MNIIVVGGGSIGRRHIQNLLQLNLDISVTVVEPFEIVNSEIIRDFDVDTYLNLKDALCAKKYEVAFICSPSHLHVRQAKMLAKKNIHLFIEKPVALSVDEALDLIPVVKEHKVHVMVGCNLRFHPGVAHMSSALKSGLIGKPIYARAHFAHYLPNWRPGQNYKTTYSAKKKQGGGILLDDIHEPDYLCWLLGNVNLIAGALEHTGNLDIDTEDIAEYTLWHKSGAYSQIHADYLRRDKSRGCEIIGTTGTLVWKSCGKKPEVVSVEMYNSDSEKWTVLYSEETYDTNQQYIDEIEYYLECIKTDDKPMNGIKEALSLISVLDTVKKASHHGQFKVKPIIR